MVPFPPVRLSNGPKQLITGRERWRKLEADAVHGCRALRLLISAHLLLHSFDIYVILLAGKRRTMVETGLHKDVKEDATKL
jgi:hypothetical protein